MVREGKRVCICGHENNLRSLLKHVDGISDEARVCFVVSLNFSLALYAYRKERSRGRRGDVRERSPTPFTPSYRCGCPLMVVGERDLYSVYIKYRQSVEIVVGSMNSAMRKTLPGAEIIYNSKIVSVL